MRLIKAKQSGKDRAIYINLDKISMFYSDQYDGVYVTKVYLPERIEIQGNHAEEIQNIIFKYVSGFFDLTEE